MEIHRIMDSITVNLISRLRNSNNMLIPNKFIWSLNKSGLFSIEFSYWLLVKEHLDIGEHQIWKLLWKSKLHERHISCFFFVESS